MVEILRHPQTLIDCRTGDHIGFQVGRSGDPDTPVFIDVSGVRWVLPRGEASSISFAGDRITRLAARARKRNAAIAEKRLYRRMSTGGEISIATVNVDDEPAVDFRFCSISAIFTGGAMQEFIAVLARIDDVLAEMHAGQAALAGGVRQTHGSLSGFELPHWARD